MAAGTKSFLASVSLIILVSICNVEAQERVTAWPPVSSDTKPWTRWWWHGSAVSKEGITSEMEAFQAVGFGGVEITPIYGVFGYEDKFINYLSPAWVEMLQHVLREAERLGLGVDMSTGTGWPFGGPWVSDDDACKTFRFKTFQLRAGDTLQEKIALAQQPLLRLVGPGTFFPLKVERRIEQRDATLELLRQIQQPVSSNKNLQALAIDQIRFERTQRLAAVLAYNGQNASVDVTHLVDSTGHLNWTPSSGTWKIYALFEGWHGKMVERAGPGGEGNVIDHFSRPAVKNYLRHFDDALADARIGGLRAFFNDSYEVDDASGAADWTPSLFEEFIRRRGYSLKEVLPALLTEEETDSSQHILCDYRQTISEMLLENFTWQWRTWAHGHGAMVRNQAHGSPANILDLYAAVDIPETEGVEPLRLRMASSAANVTGKTLVSAEAATWLNEHFRSTLSDVKSAIDGMMVNGVNHIVYHGTAYSPAEAPWPGWLFYAAVHFNQRNPIWNDLDALNTYVARCQSFLQDSRPDNDILVYFPVCDAFSSRGSKTLTHIDAIGREFDSTAFARCAGTLIKNGYSFDFISDRQISELQIKNGSVVTSGQGTYRALVIPKCKYIPIETLARIDSLAASGIRVIFFEGLPESFAGFGERDVRGQAFSTLIERLKSNDRRRNIFVTNDILRSLSTMELRRENFSAIGLEFIRKKDERGNFLYLLVNRQAETYDGLISLAVRARHVEIFDPMTGAYGRAQVRERSGKSEVYVQLAPGQSLVLRTCVDCAVKDPFIFYRAGQSRELAGNWRVTLPGRATMQTDSLVSWTNWGAAAFSGSAVYEIDFNTPSVKARRWAIDLGDVRESARVYVNERFVGTAIGPRYRLEFPDTLLEDRNHLKVVVSNLMANRIADMDRKKIFWKKFYNINFAARLPENRKDGLFNASEWSPLESGLMGPVRMVPLVPMR